MDIETAFCRAKLDYDKTHDWRNEYKESLGYDKIEVSNIARYEYKGMMLSCSEIAEIAGVSITVVRNRILWKWDIDKVVNTPARKKVSK